MKITIFAHFTGNSARRGAERAVKGRGHLAVRPIQLRGRLFPPFALSHNKKLKTKKRDETNKVGSEWLFYSTTIFCFAGGAPRRLPAFFIAFEFINFHCFAALCRGGVYENNVASRRPDHARLRKLQLMASSCAPLIPLISFAFLGGICVAHGRLGCCLEKRNCPVRSCPRPSFFTFFAFALIIPTICSISVFCFFTKRYDLSEFIGEASWLYAASPHPFLPYCFVYVLSTFI